MLHQDWNIGCESCQSCFLPVMTVTFPCWLGKELSSMEIEAILRVHGPYQVSVGRIEMRLPESSADLSAAG